MIQEAAKQSGMEAMYSRRAQGESFGPPTYTSQEFLEKICKATGLRETTRPVRVLDSMSGPELLGSGLQKLVPRHKYHYLDLVPGQLLKISGAEGKVAGDARQMPFKEGVFRVGVVRYAAKDVPQNQQWELFQQMYDITARRGRWVLADMFSPVTGNTMQDGQVYEWLNYQHAIKQEYSGRDPSKEGTCHIPTEGGWVGLLERVGFRVGIVDQHMSYVTTTDWLKSNQVTSEQLEELNQIILSAPEAVKETFNIRQKDEAVKLDYPITIIRATKP